MPAVDLSGLVLRESGACVASGRVVSSRGRLTFEPPLAQALVFSRAGHEPAPGPSGLGSRFVAST